MAQEPSGTTTHERSTEPALAVASLRAAGAAAVTALALLVGLIVRVVAPVLASAVRVRRVWARYERIVTAIVRMGRARSVASSGEADV